MFDHPCGSIRRLFCYSSLMHVKMKMFLNPRWESKLISIETLLGLIWQRESYDGYSGCYVQHACMVLLKLVQQNKLL